MSASYEPNGKDKVLAPVWKEVSDDSSEDKERMDMKAQLETARLGRMIC
jgi:hypothetical protein